MCVVRGFAAALRRVIAEKFHQSEALRELATLTDRQLEDIGVQRRELVLAVAGAAEAPERVAMMASKLGIMRESFKRRRPLVNEMVKRCAVCRAPRIPVSSSISPGVSERSYRPSRPNVVSGERRNRMSRNAWRLASTVLSVSKFDRSMSCEYTLRKVTRGDWKLASRFGRNCSILPAVPSASALRLSS